MWLLNSYSLDDDLVLAKSTGKENKSNAYLSRVGSRKPLQPSLAVLRLENVYTIAYNSDAVWQSHCRPPISVSCSLILPMRWAVAVSCKDKLICMIVHTIITVKRPGLTLFITKLQGPIRLPTQWGICGSIRNKISNRAYRAYADWLNQLYSPLEYAGYKVESQSDQLRLAWDLIWASLEAFIISNKEAIAKHENQSIRAEFTYEHHKSAIVWHAK